MPDHEKKLTLYTNHLSPNGLKVSIYLEELKAIDPAMDYNLKRVDVAKGEHKEPWFIKLNPNGHIPVLVDHTREDFVICESPAILLYLEQHYDKGKRRFSPDMQKHPREYSSMLQWIFFAHGELGAMQGQAHYFIHYALEDVPFGKKRYCDETKRLYGVLNTALNDRDWLIGPSRGVCTIADFNVLPWVRLHTRANVESLDQWPNLKSWLSNAMKRPAVQAAIQSVALE